MKRWKVLLTRIQLNLTRSTRDLVMRDRLQNGYSSGDDEPGSDKRKTADNIYIYTQKSSGSEHSSINIGRHRHECRRNSHGDFTIPLTGHADFRWHGAFCPLIRLEKPALSRYDLLGCIRDIINIAREVYNCSTSECTFDPFLGGHNISQMYWPMEKSKSAFQNTFEKCNKYFLFYIHTL